MKKIDIAQIKAGVLISKPQPVTVPIKFNGEDAEFSTFIKPYSYATTVAKLRAFGEQKEALAGILAASICDEEGNLQFTEDEVRKNFSHDLAEAIWNQVVNVNALGKTSTSQKKPNSSVKSPSQQAKASKKSKNSRSTKSKSGQSTSENTEALTSVEE